LSAAAREIGSAAVGSVKRAKYQLESTKVSSVSVSRSALPPQDGQVDVLPGRVAIQRIAGRVEGHVVRQHDRQLVGRNAGRRRSRSGSPGSGQPQ
jgi:hypothetical protein